MAAKSACLVQTTFQSTPPVKAATARNSILCVPTSFQSTPPVKAATNTVKTEPRDYTISIHAAREGGDELPGYSVSNKGNFNPRRP